MYTIQMYCKYFGHLWVWCKQGHYFSLSLPVPKNGGGLGKYWIKGAVEPLNCFRARTQSFSIWSQPRCV